jgi:hypothetical protein
MVGLVQVEKKSQRMPVAEKEVNIQTQTDLHKENCCPANSELYISSIHIE